MTIAIMKACRWRQETTTDSRMELYTKVSGEAQSDMDGVSRCGPMVPDTRVNGRITKLMARENSGT